MDSLRSRSMPTIIRLIRIQAMPKVRGRCWESPIEKTSQGGQTDPRPDGEKIANAEENHAPSRPTTAAEELGSSQR